MKNEVEVHLTKQEVAQAITEYVEKHKPVEVVKEIKWHSNAVAVCEKKEE